MRTNHHLLAHSLLNFDYQQPLKLSSTQKWESDTIPLYQILNEVIQLFPCENPFKINQSLFSQLPHRQSIMYAAAMIHFLSKIHPQFPNYQSFINEDLLFLHNIHFSKILSTPMTIISRNDSKRDAIAGLIRS